VVNAGAQELLALRGTGYAVDADDLAQASNNVKSLNLIVLGFALAVAQKMKKDPGRLFCTLADIEKVVKSIQEKGKPERRFSEGNPYGL